MKMIFYTKICTNIKPSYKIKDLIIFYKSQHIIIRRIPMMILHPLIYIINVIYDKYYRDMI